MIPVVGRVSSLGLAALGSCGLALGLLWACGHDWDGYLPPEGEGASNAGGSNPGGGDSGGHGAATTTNTQCPGQQAACA